MDITDIQGDIEDDYCISSFFPIETSCILDTKLSKLSLTLKPYEHLPVTFESEGTISSKFRGRIKVTLTNYSYQTMKMFAGSTVGYIVLQPFSLK